MRPRGMLAVVSIAPVLSSLALTGRLWWRHWPQLVLLVLVGFLANHVLLEIAVSLGLRNHVLGLCSLGIVVLVKLVVIVMMFHVLRPSLPVIAGLSPGSAPRPAPTTGDGARPHRFVEILALALAPFFAYYAAWGFLGDTVRDYSLRYLGANSPFDSRGNPLDAMDAPGLIVVVAGAWVLRKLATWRHTQHPSPVWKILITLCEATWLFIGLFVISQWQAQVVEWWHSRVVWHEWRDVTQSLQVQWPTALSAYGDVISAVGRLALYALLPVVWLAMTALIYGREVRQADELLASNTRFAEIAKRYRGLPALAHRSSEHFVKGYRGRFLPVVNSVRLTLTAGLPLLLLLCLGYRALNWLSLWAWIGVTHWIGPHSFPAWRVIGNALGLLLVDPLQTNASVLVEPLRICLLAAVLETALAASTSTAEAPTASQDSAPAQA